MVGHLEVRGGCWRHVLLVADGIDRVYADSVESPVTDSCEYDLGPSDWDDFLSARRPGA